MFRGKRYCGPKQLPENLDFTRRLDYGLLDLEEAGFRSAAQAEIQNTPMVSVEGWDRLAGTSGNDFTFISPERTGNVPFIPQARFLELLSQERAKREYEAHLYPELALRPRVFHDTIVDTSLQYREEMIQRHEISATDPSYYTLSSDMQVVRVPHYLISNPEILYNPSPIPVYDFADFKPMFPVEDERRLYDYSLSPEPFPEMPEYIFLDVTAPKYLEMFGSFVL